uniref:S4 RNA-binding domain-containing protein n=1 Tax=Panagrellus redivivus TaxID=6233 RepID=A0A7E4VXW1_PANRE
MVRQLKYHEQKLLKKVDFVSWKTDNNVHEGQILKRFAIRKREHYSTYNTLARQIREMASKIAALPDKNPNKKKLTNKLLNKLYNIGLVPTVDTLERASAITASSFCRRRLATMVVKLKMSQSVEEGARLVQEGHIRVGAEVVTDPAFLVTRPNSDLITWAKASKIRKHVESYNNIRDDFEG